MPSTAWGGAWTVPRHRWYAEYFWRYFGSKKTFDNEGNSSRRPTTATFRDIRNEWKLEYGLTNWLNLLASAPYISSHFRDDNIDLLRTGVGDIYVRTKLRALTKPVVTSAQFSWKIPSAYDPRENPIGDGQVDFESRLQLSRAFVFAPYKVPATRHAGKPPAAASANPPSASPPEALMATPPERFGPPHETAMTRDEAIREAIISAMLYKQAKRLWEEGRWAGAKQWLRAVLENHPLHEEALRLYHEIVQQAEAATIPTPPLTFASLDQRPTPPEQAPPPRVPDDEDVAMETRYAGVAFVTVEGAFTARNEDPANEFPLFVEAGFTPLKRLMLIGSFESVTSARSTHEQEEDFAKWGIRAVVNLWGEGFASVFRTERGATVNAEFGYNDIVLGRNTADAFELFFKLGIFF